LGIINGKLNIIESLTKNK